MQLEKVHEDSRGALYRVLLPTNQELMLLYSRAGSLRGGHSHTVDEIVILLTGQLEYHTLINGEDVVSIVEAGHITFHEAGEVHMGRFLKDSYLLEWKIGTTIGEWQNVEYEPYRKLVRDSLKTV